MKRFLALLITVPMLLALSSCSAVDQSKQAEVAEFYQEFVTASSVLSIAEIQAAYDEIQTFDTSGNDLDATKKKFLDRFQEINPELFSQIETKYSTTEQIAEVYVAILQLALASGSREVIVEFPLADINQGKSEISGVQVYKINRENMTVTLPVGAKNFITVPTNKSELPPVEVIESEDGSLKLLPNESTFSEIGELIAAPTEK